MKADFPDNHAWIDFRGPPGSFPQYSFSDVMAGRVPVSEFADKAVLIGKTDPIGGDVFVTSISSDPMPGVEVHANALWTVLAGIPLKSVPAPANIALILALIAISRHHRQTQIGPAHLGGIAGAARSRSGRRAIGL